MILLLSASKEAALRGRRYPAGAHGAAALAARGLPCGARFGGGPTNSLRVLRPLRSNNVGQVRARSALRAPPPNLRSSAPHRSPLPGTACRAVTAVPGSRKTARRRMFRVVVLQSAAGKGASGQDGGRLCGAEKRRIRGGARSALRDLTCQTLFERSGRSTRSEFVWPPRIRASQGSLRAAEAATPKPSGLPRRAFASHCWRAATVDRTRWVE